MHALTVVLMFQNGWSIIHHACSTDTVIEDKCLAQWLLEGIPEHILNNKDKSELVMKKNKVNVFHAC